jgi:hypothetical protein
MIQKIADLILKEAQARRVRGEHQNLASAIQAVCMKVDEILIPAMVAANERGE